jgi:hypothetical protein
MDHAMLKNELMIEPAWCNPEKKKEMNAWMYKRECNITE